jgi:histidine triad (HIT) family protein
MVKLDTCLMCNIAAKALPSTLIYEDKWIYAFEDIDIDRSLYREHILVVPKMHIVSAAQVTGDTELMYYLKVQEAVLKITQQLQATAYKVIMNTGRQAGQTVFHIHVHIYIPLEGVQLTD